ncbi:Fur family transcriptional regulator [Microbacterium sp.]|jgi:Fur family ferric uptake transcriptional regulator|uniref:Fur family transcriptional regulator n=1 Tax=Microbacterium sp. TaxID=51671 RepID=UPI0025E6E2D7|nr:Fur family transcriptional regulator [Microbacterium sp.]
MPAHSPIADAGEAIRSAGLRVTDSRRAVVIALDERPHASADEIFQRVVEHLPQTSLQSVYNALAVFVEAGLVRRIEPAGHPGLFELRVSDNHHHLICRSCGAVEDVDCVADDRPCLVPSDSLGYVVDVAEVTFWGQCATCAGSALA